MSEIMQPFQGPAMDYSSGLSLTNGPLVNISGQLPGMQKLSQPSFFSNLTAMAGGVGNLANIGTNVVSGIDNAITGMFGQRAEFTGKNAGLAQGLDSTYDTIQKAAGAFGPWGKVVQFGMAANKLASNIVGRVGGGTDGQTKLDTILGSPFFQMTPLGLINGFGGAKSDTFTKDQELFGMMGSSYGGASDTADQAAANAGKKYGLFSRGAMNEADNAIAEATRQQKLITNINADVQNRQAMQASMGQTGANAYQMALAGGYDQSAVRVGKQGLKMDNFDDTLKRAKDILKLKKGKSSNEVSKQSQSNKISEDLAYERFLNSFPPEEQGLISDNYRMYDYWKYNGKPRDFNFAVSKGIFTIDKNGKYHANTIAWNPETEEGEFMKSSEHPTVWKEEEFYKGNEVVLKQGREDNGKRENYNIIPLKGTALKQHKDFISKYRLDKSGKYWKYVRIPEFKDGGSISKLHNPISIIVPTDVKESSIINVVDSNEILEYKEGGSFNVIPEGALHARLHHIDNIDNITKKGIPVVSEDQNGNIIQQAEIEHSEIIFRLEVTKKIEELQKQYDSDKYSQDEKDSFAIEAGKLLVNEILYNTIDNTNNVI